MNWRIGEGYINEVLLKFAYNNFLVKIDCVQKKFVCRFKYNHN